MAATAVKIPTNTTKPTTRPAPRPLPRNMPALPDDANWLMRDLAIANSEPDPHICNQRQSASRLIAIHELQARLDASQAQLAESQRREQALEAENKMLLAPQTLPAPPARARMNPPWRPRILAHIQAHPDKIAWTADELRAALQAPYSLASHCREMVAKGILVGTGDTFALPAAAPAAATPAAATPKATPRTRTKKAAA